MCGYVEDKVNRHVWQIEVICLSVYSNYVTSLLC